MNHDNDDKNNANGTSKTDNGATSKARKKFHASGKDAITAERKLIILKDLAEENPDDPQTHLELATCLDSLGRTAEALPHYERVHRLGHEKLPEADQPLLFLMWGKSLHQLGRLHESQSVLMEGARRFPEMRALKAFLALAQYERGYYREAAQALFVLLHSKTPKDDSLTEYSRILDWCIDRLDSDSSGPEETSQQP